MIIQSQVSLKNFNTFGVDQYASRFAIISKEKDLLDVLEAEPHPVILGGGSNILLTKDLNGLVVKNEIKGFQLIEEDNEYARLKIYSGENWHDSVTEIVAKGWGGVENLSLIPGTVGAAPIQNIGAYGVELKDTLQSLEVIEMESGKLLEFSNHDCAFGYRDSIFKQAENRGKYFVLSVTLQLKKHPEANTQYGEIEKKLKEKNILHPDVSDMHRAIIEIRQNKLPDPAILGNAGSFFKNPIVTNEQAAQLKALYPAIPSYRFGETESKLAAGWLIDQSGWKGKRVGKVGCYEKQALVIVNHDHATGLEIWDFALMIQRDVLNKFGILIEPEINIW